MNPVPSERAIWLARNVLPHEPALRRWLHRVRGIAFDVDDVVQEAYAVLAGLQAVEHIRDPHGYLFQTARSILLRQVRRSRVVEISAMADIDEWAIASNSSPEAQVAARQELGQLAHAIAALPPQCREAFRLRRVAGLTQAEVARTMGLSQRTVEKHMSKAVRLLAERFGRGGSPARHEAALNATQEPKGNVSTRD